MSKKELGSTLLAILAFDVAVYFVALWMGAPRPLRFVVAANLCATAGFVLLTVVNLSRIR